MDLLMFNYCCFLSLIISPITSDGWTLHGHSGPLFASQGSSLVLPCYANESLPMRGLEVIWLKKHPETLVHLFQDNASRPEAQAQDYRGRANFFTERIKDGDFSLKLDSLRFRDEGRYTCRVYSYPNFEETEVRINSIGMSILHIITLIICTAASVSALLLCYLMFCRPQETDRAVNKRVLGFLHAFLPNILMFVAFVLWGLLEGYLYETMSCSALFILRPLMMIYIAPYLENMPGVALLTECAVFTIFFCSVIFCRAWEPFVNVAFRLSIAVFVLGFQVLFFLINILKKLKRTPCHRETCRRLWEKVTEIAVLGYFLLPALQMLFIFTILGYERELFIIFPVLLFLSFSCLRDLSREKTCANLFANITWIIFVSIIAIIVFVGEYMMVMNVVEDWAGWFCMSVYQKMLWTSTVYTDVVKDLELKQSFKKVLHVFGGVAVVLVSSVALMTELLLTTGKGERAVGDMRVVVFSSESIFTFFLLILIMFGPWFSSMRCLQSRQNADNTQASEMPQKTEESNDMNLLLPDVAAAEEDNQQDSMEITGLY